MKKRFLVRISRLLLSLSLSLSSSLLYAGGAAPKIVEFLPENIFTVSYQLQWKTADNVLSSGFERESILKNKLSKNNIDTESVSGTIAYQSIVHRFSVQYGWSPGINIGLTAPYLTRARKSDLSVLKSEGQEFADANADSTAGGVGDIEIWGLFRLVYSDGLDFHLGLSVNADNGFHSYDEKDKLSLGSGAREVSAFLKWRIYSMESQWMFDIKTMGTVTRKNERSNNDGPDYSIQRGNTISGLLSVSKNHKRFHFGGSFIMENRGETIIEDNKQHDGYLGYSYQLFLNYGNLSLLEHSSLKTPWEIQIVWEQIISGNNAPQNKTLSLGATAYF